MKVWKRTAASLHDRSCRAHSSPSSWHSLVPCSLSGNADLKGPGASAAHTRAARLLFPRRRRRIPTSTMTLRRRGRWAWPLLQLLLLLMFLGTWLVLLDLFLFFLAILLLTKLDLVLPVLCSLQCRGALWFWRRRWRRPAPWWRRPHRRDVVFPVHFRLHCPVACLCPCGATTQVTLPCQAMHVVVLMLVATARKTTASLPAILTHRAIFPLPFSLSRPICWDNFSSRASLTTRVGCRLRLWCSCGRRRRPCFRFSSSAHYFLRHTFLTAAFREFRPRRPHSVTGPASNHTSNISTAQIRQGKHKKKYGPDQKPRLFVCRP